MSRSRQVTRERQRNLNQVLTDFNSLKSRGISISEEFYSIPGGMLTENSQDDEFKSVQDLDNIQQFNNLNELETIQERQSEIEFSIKNRSNQETFNEVELTNRSNNHNIQLISQAININNYIDDDNNKNKIFDGNNNNIQNDNNSQNMIKQINSFQIMDNPRSAESNIDIKNIQVFDENDLKQSPKNCNSVKDLKDLPTTQNLQYKRLYYLKQKQILLNRKNQVESQLRYSYDVTSLMDQMIEKNRSLLILMQIDMLIDIIIRANFVALTILMIIIYQNDIQTPNDGRFQIYLTAILVLFRLVQQAIVMKLLFLNPYNTSNKSILYLSNQLRNNFFEDKQIIDIDYSLHPSKQKSQFDVLNARCVMFLIFPTELSIFIFKKDRYIFKNKISHRMKSYLMLSYIMQGVQAIIFNPIYLVLLWLIIFRYQKFHHYNIYLKLTFALLVFDILKYTIISVYLLVKGNSNKRESKGKQSSILHKKTISLEKMKKLNKQQNQK